MKKPNFMFVLTDDQSFWGLGRETSCIISPTIDKMSREGAYFKNFFCACPVCSPARASILTGLMPSTHGVQDWIKSGNVEFEKMPKFVQEKNAIKENEQHKIDFLDGFETYTDVLADNGYNIALSGKWHLGDTLKKRKGYEYWNSILRGGCSNFSYEMFHNGEVTSQNEYVTDKITDNAIEFIENYKSKNPFYLGVHYTAPHTPWDKKEHKNELVKLYDDADFSCVPNEKINKEQILHKYIGDTDAKRREWLTGHFAAITGVDQSLGRIVDALKQNNQFDDTIIIFTGDNGINLGQHGVWGKGNGTYPQNMFEESIKVPFIMYSPKYIKQQEVENLCSHVDIFPTILDLAKIEYTPCENRWGDSLLKVMCGELKHSHVVVYDEYGAVRMIRNERYKFTKNYKNGEERFFDLKNDPKEATNQIDKIEYVLIVDSMRRKMEIDFEKYSTKEKDARQQNNVGNGQKFKVDNTLKIEAFDTNVTMYYGDRK